MTQISELRIDSSEASKIIKRLSNHWRHKFEISQDANTTIIPFSDIITCDLVALDDHILVKLRTSTLEELEQYQGVVLVHLNRMAGQEFPANWIHLNT